MISGLLEDLGRSILEFGKLGDTEVRWKGSGLNSGEEGTRYFR